MEPGRESRSGGGARFSFGSSRSSTGKPEYNRRSVARILDGFAAAVPTLLLAVLLPGFAGRLLGALAGAAYILFSDGLTCSTCAAARWASGSWSCARNGWTAPR